MTRKILLCTALTILCFTSTYAQDDDLKAGFKIGFNSSNVYDSYGEDFVADPKVGFAAGGFLSIPFDKHFGLQPELLISQKGFRGQGRLAGSNYSFKRTSTFIDIPILFQVKPIEYITLLAGPQYSFLTNQRDVYTYGTNSLAQEQEFNNENIRKNILGFSLGVDFNLKPAVIAIRYGFDLQQNRGDGTSTTPRYKNVWLQLMAGFKF
ncbi:MAG: PorT family protein [Bacteroidia bacterium]|nr:PorT family protein [Bacteroidia bacterium]